MSITLTLTVDNAELAKRLVDLAAGVSPAITQPQSAPPPVQPPVQPQQQYAPVAPPQYSAPMQTPPTYQQPASVTPPAPAQAPVAPPPGYTYDDLARAASTLMDTGKQQELLALLGRFGVQALNFLPKEHYGEFATALRGLGAKL